MIGTVIAMDLQRIMSTTGKCTKGLSLSRQRLQLRSFSHLTMLF